MRRIAVIGSGISGLAVAHGLGGTAHVTLFEADARFGGHTNTVDITLGGVTHGVDTGFLVLNERTYPNLLRLFDTLGVEIAESDMSFSVRVPDAEIKTLIDIAIELHSKAREQQTDWRWWVPIVASFLGSLVAVLLGLANGK